MELKLDSTQKQLAELATKFEALSNELTGGPSIPILTCKVGFHLFNSDTSKFTPPDLHYVNNQWATTFTIKNEGHYTIPHIGLHRVRRAFREVREDAEISPMEYLQPGETRIVEPLFVVKIVPTLQDTYEFVVRWRNISYSYQVAVGQGRRPENQLPEIKEFYHVVSQEYDFEGQKYQTSEDLQTAIRQKMKW